jgi:hypothetical protein
MGAFFDRADRGVQIVIRRRANTAYTLPPLNDEEDEELTSSQVAFIDSRLANIGKGGSWEYSSEEFKKRCGL